MNWVQDKILQTARFTQVFEEKYLGHRVRARGLQETGDIAHTVGPVPRPGDLANTL